MVVYTKKGNKCLRKTILFCLSLMMMSVRQMHDDLYDGLQERNFRRRQLTTESELDTI